MQNDELAVLIEDKLREEEPEKDYFADIVCWLDDFIGDSQYDESDLEYLVAEFEMATF